MGAEINSLRLGDTSYNIDIPRGWVIDVLKDRRAKIPHCGCEVCTWIDTLMPKQKGRT